MNIRSPIYQFVPWKKCTDLAIEIDNLITFIYWLIYLFVYLFISSLALFKADAVKNIWDPL